MKLSKVKIPDIYGLKNTVLDGEYTKDELIEELANQWIPYVDCARKCFRSDYCIFTQKHPHNPNRLTDVQCDVAVRALKVFVNTTYSIVEASESELYEVYFEGAYQYTKFILDAEHAIGRAIDEVAIEDFGEYGPIAFGQITKLRENLNSLASCLQNFPEFRSKKGVLFVEGWGEKAFLERMKNSHSAWFLHLNVEVYNGTGNRRPKRIKMLLDNYKKQGYIIYLQGDADGRQTDVFRELIRGNSVDEKSTFVFKQDFESAIPVPIFMYILHQLGLISKQNHENIEKKLQEEDVSFVKTLKTNFRIDLNPYKLDIAEAVADLLNSKMRYWWQDKKFMETEFGAFLSFVQNIK